MNELQRIIQAFKHSQEIGQKTALATVVQTRGSVYRRSGARMLVTQEGEIVSAISGGCLEGDLLEKAKSHLRAESDPIIIQYDTSNSQEDLLIGFGMGCRGVVDVLIESLSNNNSASQLSFIEECLKSHQLGVIATVVAVEGINNIPLASRLMMKSDGTVINQIKDSHFTSILREDIEKIFIQKQNHTQSYSLSQGKISVFWEVIHPPTQLLIFGAGYDAIPVVNFAKQLGWHVTVIDHREEYLTSDRFPQADKLLECKPDPPNAYAHLLTPQTVAVVMTHRYLSDLAFLKNLIPSSLRYLGVLGPKKRMEQLWQDLAQSNIKPTLTQQKRLYNPIGLDIGAETPEEIALAIIAEIQAVVAGRAGNSLRDRQGSIHTKTEQSWVTLVS
ncbi:MAG: XdhC family protein [Moorea sp. SIO2B7]|nr:XdhC family protein [Moorena sp. SIO2B7]